MRRRRAARRRLDLALGTKLRLIAIHADRCLACFPWELSFRLLTWRCPKTLTPFPTSISIVMCSFCLGYSRIFVFNLFVSCWGHFALGISCAPHTSFQTQRAKTEASRALFCSKSGRSSLRKACKSRKPRELLDMEFYVLQERAMAVSCACLAEMMYI